MGGDRRKVLVKSERGETPGRRTVNRTRVGKQGTCALVVGKPVQLTLREEVRKDRAREQNRT